MLRFGTIFNFYKLKITIDFNNFRFDNANWSEDSGFKKMLNTLTPELNSAYSILKTLIFICAVCLIYLGIAAYATAKGGQGESDAKKLVKKGVIGILLISSIGSIITLVYSIAIGLKLAS